MRASLMAVGAFVLVLGGCMMAATPLTSSFGFFNIAQNQYDAVNQALRLALAGLIIAPVGAAILAYGIGASAAPLAPKEESAEPAAPDQPSKA